MTEVELKPCPFCGDVPPKTVKRTDYDEAYVECGCCEAKGPLSWTDAIAAWNRRALDAARGESAGWRDIASAPKDGAWVMCWGPDCLHGIAKFSPNPIWAEYPEYTHWQPLPPAPGEPAPETADERQAAIVAMIRDFASRQDCRGCPNMEPNLSLNLLADAIESGEWRR